MFSGVAIYTQYAKKIQKNTFLLVQPILKNFVKTKTKKIIGL